MSVVQSGGSADPGGQPRIVDPSAIEKGLAELWRRGSADDEHAIARAALWNVVAHTAGEEHRALASTVLGRASAAVPQRTIVICAQPSGEAAMSASIRTNCHDVGGGKEVCSEETSLFASGDRIYRIPPLVSSLLLPDMPVAIWWIGDLPNEREEYVETLLEPADRLIVDSIYFDSPADLALIARVAERTSTAPADLNWVRLEEWRVGTASLFDPPAVRSLLQNIRSIRITASSGPSNFFGHLIESLLFGGWMAGRLKHLVGEDGSVQGPAGAVEYLFETRQQTTDIGAIALVEIGFEDGSAALISRDPERGVVTTTFKGQSTAPESVTRTLARSVEDLIVRQLKRPEVDRVLRQALPLAARLAKRLA